MINDAGGPPEVRKKKDVQKLFGRVPFRPVVVQRDH
jgi:hypothetical protein